MVRCVMTLIIYVRRNMKWMMTLTFCMFPFIKILRIKYTYGYMNQLMAQNIFFISNRMGEIGGLFRTKGI